MKTDHTQRSRARVPWAGRQRRILFIAAIALACPFIVFLTAKHYSDRNYAARLAAIRATGSPATLEELVKYKAHASVPDEVQEGETNAAKPSGENPPVTAQVAGDLDALRESPEEMNIRDILERLHNEGLITPEDMETLKAYLEKYGPLLQRLHEAGAQTPGSFPLDYSKGFEMELPHLARTRTAVRLLQAEATYEALLGNADGAFNALTAAMSMYQPLRQEDLIISVLVIKACNDTVLATLAETLGRVTYSDAQLSHLQQSFASAYDPEALANAFVTERVFGTSAFDDPARFMNARINWLEELLPGASATLVRTANAFGWFTQDRVHYLDAMDTLIQAARMPYAEARNAFPDLEAGRGSVLNVAAGPGTTA